MIACPKCEWQPPASARWRCTCGHSWNTFDTAGRCPACGHVWRDTQCLACSAWSPHHEWYRDLPSVDELVGDIDAVREARVPSASLTRSREGAKGSH